MKGLIRRPEQRFLLYALLLLFFFIKTTPSISSAASEATSTTEIQEDELANPSDEGIENLALQLTLREAIQRALLHNRSFQISMEGVQQARLNLKLAESAFETKVTPAFTENYAENGTRSSTESYELSVNKKIITGANLGLSAKTTAFDNTNVPYSSNLTASLTQPLLRGAWPLVVTSPLVDAQRGLLSQEWTFQQRRQDLILQVISSYYQILNQTQLVDINEKSLDRVEKFLRATKERQKVGLATQLDALRAELQVSTQKQSLLLAVQDMNNRLEAFNIVLGLDMDQTVELIDEIVYQPEDVDRSSSIATALENRIDYEIARLRVEDDERHLNISWRDQLPRIDLSTSYTWSQSDDSLHNSWELKDHEWRVGLIATYTFPATSESISYEQTRIILRNSRRSLEELRANIIKEVRAAVRNVTESQKRIEMVKGEVEQAEKRLKVATFRFERGMADNLEVVLAEENLLRAKNNYSSAVADYLISQSRLKLSMGVLNEE